MNGEQVIPFGVRPADLGQFRCQCCGALIKESWSPWHWYSERFRCWKCGTVHVVTANEYGCRVAYQGSEKGTRMAEYQRRHDTSPGMID